MKIAYPSVSVTSCTHCCSLRLAPLSSCSFIWQISCSLDTFNIRRLLCNLGFALTTLQRGLAGSLGGGGALWPCHTLLAAKALCSHGIGSCIHQVCKSLWGFSLLLMWFSQVFSLCTFSPLSPSVSWWRSPPSLSLPGIESGFSWRDPSESHRGRF